MKKKFLGYEKDEDGNLIIDDKHAKVVRHIYKEYLDGKGTNRIAKELEAEKVKGPTGSTKWYQSTVLSILAYGRKTWMSTEMATTVGARRLTKAISFKRVNRYCRERAEDK